METEKVICKIPHTDKNPLKTTLLKSLVQAPNKYLFILRIEAINSLYVSVYRKDIFELYEGLWQDKKQVMDDTALSSIFVEDEDMINFLLHNTCDFFVAKDQEEYILKAKNIKKRTFDTICCSICYKYVIEPVIPNDKFHCTHNKEYCEDCYDNIEQYAICRST